MSLEQRKKFYLFAMGIGTNIIYIVLVLILINAYNPESVDRIYYTIFPLLFISILMSLMIIKQFDLKKIEMIKAII
jgi:hypothetical protein